MENGELLKVKARLSNGYAVVKCPFCGEEHLHGTGCIPGVRTSHCKTMTLHKQYMIESIEVEDQQMTLLKRQYDSLIERLRKRYNKYHDFFCICDCNDSTYCRVENKSALLWAEDGEMQMLGPDGPYREFVENCPICGKKLPTTLDGWLARNHTNGDRTV